VKYNDILRWVYDTLFEMNVECDFIFPDSENIEEYKAIVIPALYAAPGKLLERIKNYVKSGGHILTTFKSAYANENLKVYAEKQPARLSEVFGISYNQFTFPKNVALQGDGFELSPEDRQIKVFMECIKPEGADVISSYDHYNWNKYAAVTKNKYGKGTAIYLGTWTSMAYLKKLFTILCKDAGIKLHEETGVTIRSGYNDENKKITYYLNYSKEEKQVQIKTAGRNLLTGERINQEQKVCIKPWDVLVVEGDDDECII
jgi:beta-galactosidase